jgi:hypothetical protein
MLRIPQTLLATLGVCRDELVLALESINGNVCAPACAALVFMARCESAPHPAMSERMGRLASWTQHGALNGAIAQP